MNLHLSMVALVMVVICGSAGAYTASTLENTNDPSSNAQTPAPTDPQIAAITVAADHVAIETGVLARAKTHNLELLHLADRLVGYHQRDSILTYRLMSKLNLFPEENEASQNLIEAGKTNRLTLQNLSGAAFDRVFLEQMIAYQRQLLATLEGTLIPCARNADLKTFLIQEKSEISDDLALTLKTQTLTQAMISTKKKA